MNKSERKSFDRLKAELANTLRAGYQNVPEDITQWKSKTIEKLQEDLLEKVNGRISEKWFYTHIKSDHDSLPRIDILDLLSQYVGFQGWEDFLSEEKPVKKKVKWYFLLPIPLLLLAIIGMYYSGKGSHQFCFIDTYTKQVINPSEIEVFWLKKGESPIPVLPDSTGCFTFNTNSSSIKLIIKSAYYHSDTLTRYFDERRTYEKLRLRTDEYARIIRLVSDGKLEEWSERKLFLENMFTDNAKIYQLMSQGNYALAIYNKEEFVRKLMLPSGTLKKLDVIDTEYEGDKISVLRFKTGKR